MRSGERSALRVGAHRSRPFLVLVLFVAACGESRGGPSGERASAGTGGAAGSVAGTHTATVGGGGGVAGEASAAGGVSVGSGRGGVPSSDPGGMSGMSGMSGMRAAAAGAGGASGAAGSAAGGAAGTTGGMTMAGAGSGGRSPDVTVNLDEAQQTMDGFGISDTFATALTEGEANAFFDPTIGIGLSILRVTMGSSGDAISSNTWSDITLAKARGVTTFIANAWTAQANCKSNGSENDGGHLTTSCYEAWAAKLAAFPALVKGKTDVDLYGLSPQQEPDFASCGTQEPCNGNFPSMLFTSDELVAFVKVLGPKLRALNPPVRLLGPDSQEWIHLWTNDSAPGSTDPLRGIGYDYGHALYRDTIAWDLTDIIATQQYDTQTAEPWPSDVPQTKPVWMTEMSGTKWWPEQGPSDDIKNGVVVAGWIHDAIVNGPASTWLYFWHAAEFTDDNEGLFLQNGSIAKRFYTLGNFSKFVRPGYTRLNITGIVPSDVLLTAYKGPDGTVVVVAINRGSSPAVVPIYILGGPAPASLTPTVTSASDDLAPKLALAVSGGSFTAALDGMTVTTFVGKSQ